MPAEKCLFYDYTQKLLKNMLEAVRAYLKVFEQQKKTRIQRIQVLLLFTGNQTARQIFFHVCYPKVEFYPLVFLGVYFFKELYLIFCKCHVFFLPFYIWNLCLEMRIMFLLFYGFNKGEYYLNFQIFEVWTHRLEILNHHIVAHEIRNKLRGFFQIVTQSYEV